jgi:hypothetical protein
MRLLASLSEYLLVLPLVTIRYLLTEFVLNLILRSLTNICRHIRFWLQRTLHMCTNIILASISKASRSVFIGENFSNIICRE